MGIKSDNATNTTDVFSFEVWWANQQQQRAQELASKYASVKEAFVAFRLPEEIRLLASVLHPEQRVLRWEKTGSAQMSSTGGLPFYAERDGYDTVAWGTLLYFHPSTLKEGDTVEHDGRVWEVLVNQFQRGSAVVPAFQCLYLLEVIEQ